MASGSTIQIKVGAVELTLQGALDDGELDRVLGSLRRQLPELLDQDAETAPPPTARAMLERADARTFGDKAGVIAFWLEEHQGRRDWRSADIVDALTDVGESTPANITDTLNQKARKGLFEVHDRRWKLTGEGRGWVKYQLLALRETED